MEKSLFTTGNEVGASGDAGGVLGLTGVDFVANTCLAYVDNNDGFPLPAYLSLTKWLYASFNLSYADNSPSFWACL